VCRDQPKEDWLVEFWNKLNAKERLAGIGAIVIIVSWLVGIASGVGFGSSIALIGAIIVLVIYYLKYSPTQNVNWPSPVPTIVLIVSGIVAILAILGALSILSFLGAFATYSILYTISVIGTVVGALIMVWGAWQDYQAMPKSTPPGSSPRM
jgi:multisubunit Na+/H+ antiporter MnhG subunit